METLTIREAAKELSLSAEAIEWMIKWHRIASCEVEEVTLVDKGDVDYFARYIAYHGKLPNFL